jgi:glucose-6-phosphate isomerase, archaeal
MLDPRDLPLSLFFDIPNGILEPAGNTVVRTVGDLRKMFFNQPAIEEILALGDRPVYEIRNYAFLTSCSDLAVSVTRIFPGTVGSEYHMSKGHQHERDDQAEIYFCLQGTGYLLLDTMQGEFQAEAWQAGVITHIPAQWAHRVVNTGPDLLVYIGFYHVKAGHIYDLVEKQGFQKVVVEQNGQAVLIPHPRLG